VKQAGVRQADTRETNARWKCPERSEYGCEKPIVFVYAWNIEEFGMPVRHAYYRCPTCRTRLVSTNGGPPELASSSPG
jgi:hypothetical protein